MTLTTTKSLNLKLYYRAMLNRWNKMLHDGRRMKKLQKEVKKFERGCEPIKISLQFEGKGIKSP